MIWVTWRQHRLEALNALLLFAVVAAVLLVTGLPMHTAYTRDGVATCLASTGSQEICSEVVGRFLDRYYDSTTNLLIPWFLLLPALAGIFVGAPLLAREFEHGTWQLAWTQAVPRGRWLAIKLAILTPGVAAAAAAFSLLYAWWQDPITHIDGRFNPDTFAFAVPTFTATAVFAFAAGAALGAFIRRTVSAMAATLGVFLAVRIPLQAFARPHYARPKTILYDPAANNRPTRTNGDWILAQGYAHPTGRHLTDLEENTLVHAARTTHTDLAEYAHQQGLRRWTTYHPADRYWQFQAIEAGIYILVAVLLVAALIWHIRRRVT